MATLAKRGGKTPSYEVQFYLAGKSAKRTTIYLGGRRYTEKTANGLKDVVERLIHFRDNDILPDKKTLTWLESASPEIREKLEAVGLIKVPKTYTVKELWDTFLEKKTGIKESTETIYENAKRRFFEFFKETELISELTQGRMREWRDSLRKELAEATVAGTLSKAKAVFNWAVEFEWLEESPLKGLGVGSYVNHKNDRNITMDEYFRLLEVCPCPDWRGIIALARIGGLRCPSEALRLRWADVNWIKNRFYVTSPKTEHHEGKEGREVPLFPELRSELEKLFSLSTTEGTEFVINRYRDPERTNLGTQFARIVKLAGLEPIPRPFDNMRASRSTEVYADFGAFLESEWIGHTVKTARKHYLQLREEDFERAAEMKFDSKPSGYSTPKRTEPSPSGIKPLQDFLNPLH